MKSLCPYCSKYIYLITVKNGSLFDEDKPYEVFIPHKKVKYIFFKVPCIGSNTIPSNSILT